MPVPPAASTWAAGHGRPARKEQRKGVSAVASTVIAVAATLAAFVLAFVAVSYERELRSMARFLAQRERGSNERLTVEFSTRGIAGVARAVNAELDAQRDARIEREQRERAFREDLAALSHDIRTPLAGAQGYVQLFERAEGEEERGRCLAAAQERLAAMRTLTDDLFEYAKSADEHSPLSLAPVCLFSAAADALAGLYPQFAQRGWNPEVDFEDEAACVLADADALARVLSNVFANALRHGAAAPRIVQRGPAAIVSNTVADVEGIDPERLFSRFYRAQASRAGGGSGLGLAIVAQLVERMGGGVRARLEGDVLSIELRFVPADR